jgi:predicted DNA-binding mobile mystery protein A
MKPSKLARMQLDRQLSDLRSVLNLTRPLYGWLKTIRNALGMTSRQFAQRMGVAQARASAIESGEIEDSLTLKTIKEASAALNCRFVYFLIPEKSLEEIVNEQAVKFVKSSTESVAHSMTLENQGIAPEDANDFIKIKAEEIMQKNSAKIWDVE